MGSTQTKSKARPRPKSAQATQRASVKETGTSFKSSTGAGDQKGRDVMISYSHQDVDVMRKIECKSILNPFYNDAIYYCVMLLFSCCNTIFVFY